MYLTGAHALRSDRPHDYAQTIVDATHEWYRFTFYEQLETGAVRVAGWEDFIISQEELYKLLKERENDRSDSDRK